MFLPGEMRKNLVLLLLNNKFELNLNELPNDFSIKYRGVNFHSYFVLS